MRRFHFTNPLEELEKIMSEFLDTFRKTLETVAQGGGADPETKAAVVQLKAQLASNDATDQELETAINELVNKLAVLTPPGV